MAGTFTKLRMPGLPLPPFTDREGLSQSLEPIGGSQAKRTVNGQLVFLDNPAVDKYRSSISGSDIQGPLPGGDIRGRQTDVECVQEFSELIPAGNSSVTLARPEVSGSVYVLLADGSVRDDSKVNVTTDADGNTVVELTDGSGGTVTLGQNAWARYRPRLTMQVVGFSGDADDLAASTNWSIELEEV